MESYLDDMQSLDEISYRGERGVNKIARMISTHAIEVQILSLALIEGTDKIVSRMRGFSSVLFDRKESASHVYCEKCNTLMKVKDSIIFEIAGLECPKCGEGELIRLGKMTDLQARVFQFDTASEDFSIERWKKKDSLEEDYELE